MRNGRKKAKHKKDPGTHNSLTFDTKFLCHFGGRVHFNLALMMLTNNEHASVLEGVLKAGAEVGLPYWILRQGNSFRPQGPPEEHTCLCSQPYLISKVADFLSILPFVHMINHLLLYLLGGRKSRFHSGPHRAHRHREKKTNI